MSLFEFIFFHSSSPLRCFLAGESFGKAREIGAECLAAFYLSTPESASLPTRNHYNGEIFLRKYTECSLIVSVECQAFAATSGSKQTQLC